MEEIPAIYENGVLRPLRALDLPNGAHVMVRIKSAEVVRCRGLDEVIKEISREYVDIEEDPLKRFLAERR